MEAEYIKHVSHATNIKPKAYHKLTISMCNLNQMTFLLTYWQRIHAIKIFNGYFGSLYITPLKNIFSDPNRIWFHILGWILFQDNVSYIVTLILCNMYYYTYNNFLSLDNIQKYKNTRQWLGSTPYIHMFFLTKLLWCNILILISSDCSI